VRELAAALLEETEFQVVEASSTEEALSYLGEQASEVALALIDIKLPCQIDGVELARTIGAQSWKITSLILVRACLI
jgi:CheY-like chemotaxis protein